MLRRDYSHLSHLFCVASDPCFDVDPSGRITSVISSPHPRSHLHPTRHLSIHHDQPHSARPLPSAATPDTASFQYDETSGYYYDATTSLYYDANSQYFYNPANQRYLYWDAAKSKYVPMSSDGESPASGAGGKKKEDKHEKVKVAKKIAKVRGLGPGVSDSHVYLAECVQVGRVCCSTFNDFLILSEVFIIVSTLDQKSI